jgi:mitochondrial fission protein ELM1
VTSPAACPAPGPVAPTAWALLGSRPGDNSQIVSLAEALGWPYEAKHLVYNARYKRRNVLLGASLASLDTGRSSPLAPPWPDLVIASGRRSVPVARWIRRHAGGRTRLVHIGRPWAPLALFDLVITTPQYRLPVRPNVLHNTLPLGRVDPARRAAEAARWVPRLAALPRPFVALLVGGDSRPYVLDPATAARLARDASALAASLGGSLLVTSGPRLRAGAAEAVARAVSGPAHVHRWRPGDDDNPYQAYLALADRFVVTGDSASMLAEACATGKPVAIVELPEDPGWCWRAARGVSRWIDRRRARAAAGGPGRRSWPERIWERLIDLGLVTQTRDLGHYHRVLEASGLATRLGDNPLEHPRQPPDDLGRAVQRVTRLMAAARR